MLQPEDLAFCRRTSDGRYYRGARFWRWTKSWRRAAVVTVSFWRQIVLPQRLRGQVVELVDVRDAIRTSVRG